MRVVVLGAGIVGLWTAEVLSARGYEVTVRSQTDVLGTTSAAAVAVITPLFPGTRDDPSFQRSIEWYRRTLERFTSIEEGAFVEWLPACEFGVTIAGERFLEKDFRVDKFEDVGLDAEFFDVDPPIVVDNHIDDQQHITFGARFSTPLCNSEIFLSWLQSELQRRGVTFDLRAISSLDELESYQPALFINCLGHQAKQFFPDPDSWTVRGQSMFIAAAVGPPFFGIAAGNHAIFKHRRGFYLGSYFLEREKTVRLSPSRVEYELSLRFAQEAYPKLCLVAGHEVPSLDLHGASRVNTGIRPFRLGGPRIEVEVVDGLQIIHHYGHGAHGWTIGYGTALEVADLVEQCGRDL